MDGEVLTTTYVPKDESEAYRAYTAKMEAKARQVMAEQAERLAAIAAEVHSEFTQVVRGTDARFRLGHLINEAHAILPGNKAFGDWFRAQHFGFTIRTGHNYASAADLESEMRSVMDRSSKDPRSENISAWPVSFTQALEMARQDKDQAPRISTCSHARDKDRAKEVVPLKRMGAPRGAGRPRP